MLKNSSLLAILTIVTTLLTACAGFFEKDNTPAPTPLINYQSRSLHRSLLWQPAWCRSQNRIFKNEPSYQPNGNLYC